IAPQLRVRRGIVPRGTLVACLRARARARALARARARARESDARSGVCSRARRMPIHAIDSGTNTVLLLVATTHGSGQLTAVEERATITRLGEGVDLTRVLAPAAIARTNAAIDACAEIVQRRGVTRLDVVGTSAMRDAEGGEAVRAHVRARLGVEARVI